MRLGDPEVIMLDEPVTGWTLEACRGVRHLPRALAARARGPSQPQHLEFLEAAQGRAGSAGSR